MQFHMPTPGEFTRLATADTHHVIARPVATTTTYVREEEPTRASADRMDYLARLKPADRRLFEEREMELAGEQSAAARIKRESDQELHFQRQEERIEDMEKQVKQLKKELSVARNNQRSFGTRSEDNEIARLRRRVQQLEFENNELRSGAYVSIDEGIGQRGAIALRGAHSPELRSAQRSRSVPSSPEPGQVAPKRKTNSKYAHVKPKVTTKRVEADAGPMIMYESAPTYVDHGYGNGGYLNNSYVEHVPQYRSGYPVGAGYSSASYAPTYGRAIERVIDETPRVYSASRIIGSDSIVHV